MDGAIVFLLVFIVFCILLGICIARVAGLAREIDGIKQVLGVLGTVQRDVTKDA